jgi:VWFA-related protein
LLLVDGSLFILVFILMFVLMFISIFILMPRSMRKIRRGAVPSCDLGNIVAPVRVLAVALCLCSGLHGQGLLPFVNAGPDSAFSQIDFAQIYMDNTIREQKNNVEQKAARQHLVDIGAVSALDLDAPNKALDEYNRAATLMKEQNSKQAIVHLQKAIAAYPKFVLAHNTLGLAYLDQQDSRAKSEFEMGTKLDDRFPGSFLNLGMLALSANDFASADVNLEKAASLSPKDTKVLSALAFAQNGNHEYVQTLETARQVHALDHRGMANVHYIAAAAAMALKDNATIERELTLFLTEDPTNPLAPVARKNLDILDRQKTATAPTPGLAGGLQPAVSSDSQRPQTFANSERLASQLKAVKDEPAAAGCENCSAPGEKATTAANLGPAPVSSSSAAVSSSGAGIYTMHTVVDETTLFFAVSSHGQMVNDLQPSEIQIRDDERPPQKILQFIPQSKLPLRLGLLIDTSGSVQDRFSFEKRAAGKFLQKVLNGTSDLGFVVGFSSDTNVTQDFTAEPKDLKTGIDKLSNGGGTALFDAVSFACWKLAAYPETERVAKVLVVISDGEDNSSHRSLKQTIEEAETSGVTIYTLSTSDDSGAKTDADRVLQVLAERSGGDSLFPGDLMVLDKSLDKLRDLIRSRYLVAYRAADFAPDGKYHRILITADRDGKHLRVHARKGYYARLAAPQN